MRKKKLTWFQWFMQSWLYLMVIWLFMGFALGTLVLLFPLRSWVNYVRENDLSESAEKIGVIVMMLILALVSFLISWKIHKCHLRKKKIAVTIASITIPFFLAVAALMLFMSPNLVNSGSERSEVSQQFTIGPYPTADKIKELKKEGFTGVISLLHPAVVPFEPSLLSDEQKATKDANIELVKAPMLPWIGDNSASLKKIEDIVKSGKGKFYVHCYLGKDRVNVVKNLIAKVSGGNSGIESEIGHSSRTFETMKRFERGDIYKLDEEIYMTPFPTDEEFLSFFLAGKVKSVVCMLENNEDNIKWIEKEKKELQKTSVVYKLHPLRENASDQEMAAIVKSIQDLPKPLVVHSWSTKFSDNIRFRKIFSQATNKSAINLATNVPETY
jgi:protein tyrosine phosphatase (PTP) superfamily phosphohydrolase (DUF442 family)